MTDKQLIEKYGEPGTNLVRITFPYKMYYDGQRAKTTWIHEQVSISLINALNEIAEHYGDERIQQLGLNVYDGCFNKRKERGGDNWSTHAFGIAIDLNAKKNGLETSWNDCLFSKPEYASFISIMEKWGWYSKGKYDGFDAMHFCAEKYSLKKFKNELNI